MSQKIRQDRGLARIMDYADGGEGRGGGGQVQIVTSIVL